MKYKSVLAAFGLVPGEFDVQPYGTGHINKTYRARSLAGREDYILQRINTNVFKRPEVIAQNVRLTSEYLAKAHPDYLFAAPIPTTYGEPMSVEDGEVWRLTPFVAGTVTLDKADSPKQAYEAARQFGRLTRLTAEMDLSAFEPTIPDFHNLSLRFAQLEAAIASASDERKMWAGDVVDGLLAAREIVDRFEALAGQGGLPDRLMHHDTKISNVLLREGSFEGVCVVDLDTLMPGKVISDLGDMVRTYVCPASEEEADVTRVVIRDEYFAALMDGYLSETRAALTALEREELFYAGEFMVYMQAVRFLADYLNGDVYYPVKYDRHNLYRARNQWTLLTRLREKEQPLQKIIRECL
jgi:Ser/Thr protein kinase RdoA (MazF antagonist)